MKIMIKVLMLTVLTCSIALAAAVQAAAQVMVVDRGLPVDNLNNAASSNRSNVSWSYPPDWVTGDDFTIGTAGDVWIVTKVRGWSTQGAPGGLELGDRFQSVTLYGGPIDSIHLPLTNGTFLYGTAITPLMSGNLELGSSSNSNSNITHTRVQYAGGLDYQGYSGLYIQLWQHDFNLAWVVNGGQKYGFSADGVLRTGVTYNWFNHASNAALSGSTQDGADGLYLGWYRLDMGWMYVNDSNGNGWDKSSDINVQIFAKRVATNKDLCKNGGYMTVFRANGTSFKNQGECVSYVVANGK